MNIRAHIYIHTEQKTTKDSTNHHKTWHKASKYLFRQHSNRTTSNFIKMLRYWYNSIIGNDTSRNSNEGATGNLSSSSNAYRFRARAPAPKHKGPTSLLTAETVANVVEDLLVRVEDLQQAEEQKQNSDQIARAQVTPEQQGITSTMTNDVSPLVLSPAANTTAPVVAYSLTAQNIDYSSSEVSDSEASDNEQVDQIAAAAQTTTTSTTNVSQHEALFEANSSSSSSSSSSGSSSQDSDSDSSEEEEEEVTPRRSSRVRVPTNRLFDFVNHDVAEGLGAFDSQVMESDNEDGASNNNNNQRRVHFHPDLVTGSRVDVDLTYGSDDEQDVQIAGADNGYSGDSDDEQDFGNDGTFDPIEFSSDDVGTAIVPSNGSSSSSNSSNSSSNSSHARDIARGARDRFLPTITTLKANLTLANEHNAALQAERDTAQSRVQELEEENAALKKDNAKKTRQLTLGKRIANEHGFGGSRRKRQRR